MTEEDFKLMAQLAHIRVIVLQRAIGALIATHPNPGAFATQFATATAIAQVDHHLTSDAEPWMRKAAAEFAEELLDLAHGASARRGSKNGG